MLSKDEVPDEEGVLSLLPTLMVLEIYNIFDLSSPYEVEINKWMVELSSYMKKANEVYDFVSLGDFIVMINVIDQLIGDSIASEINHDYLNDLVEELTNINARNVQEYNTLIALSQIYDVNISHSERNHFESYMSKVQNENGSFPIYGKLGQPDDILTTYLFIKVNEKLTTEIPDLYSLKAYLNDILYKEI